jgi:hypothetical protein
MPYATINSTNDVQITLLTTPQTAAPLYLHIENKQTQTSTVPFSRSFSSGHKAFHNKAKEKHQYHNTHIIIHNNKHSYFRSTYKRKQDRNTKNNAQTQF